MKSFIMKNKFFTCLFLIALCSIVALSAYALQNKPKEEEEVLPPAQVETPKDPNKEAEITSMSARYERSSNGISGNVITVSWKYNENASKIRGAYLYLNDNTPINVTSNSYYDFTQGVYDYQTGENKIKLVLQLENGKTVEKEKTVFVKHIISTKQDVKLEGTTLNISLEYVYSTINPVEIPDILITNNDSDYSPMVTYLDTQTKTSGNKTIATTSFSLVWNDETTMPKEMNLRWKFNAIQDSFDTIVTTPDKADKEDK